MVEERRAAVRLTFPQAVTATVNGTPVRIVDMSRLGARLEHDQRFPLVRPQLKIEWRGTPISVGFRVARSEIVGRNEAGLLYQTGIQFIQSGGGIDVVIAGMLRWAETGEYAPDASASSPEAQAAGEISPEPVAPEPETQPAFVEPVRVVEVDTRPAFTPAAPETSTAKFEPKLKDPRTSTVLEDTWTRQVKFLKSDSDDDLQYAQFRLTTDGWEKDYVALPDQPGDGFTIDREQADFADLQRTYQYADDDTRRMIRIALESQLAAKKRG